MTLEYHPNPSFSLICAGVAPASRHAARLRDCRLLASLRPSSSFSSGMAVSYDGLFACEQMIRGTDAGKTQCVKFRSSTSSDSVRSFVMTWSVNQGEGSWRFTNGSDEGAVYANRLMQGSGRITGILRKVPAEATPEQANNDAALRAALEALAASR